VRGLETREHASAEWTAAQLFCNGWRTYARASLARHVVAASDVVHATAANAANAANAATAGGAEGGFRRRR
jgi:hypothetical protein